MMQYLSDDDYDSILNRVHIVLGDHPIQDRLKAKQGLEDELRAIIEMAQSLGNENRSLWIRIRELERAFYKSGEGPIMAAPMASA